MPRASEELNQLPKTEVLQNEVKNPLPTLQDVINKIEEILQSHTTPDLNGIRSMSNPRNALPGNVSV